MKTLPKVLAGTAAAMLLLAGCSSSSDTSDKTTEPAAASSMASDASSAMAAAGDIPTIATGAPELATLVTALGAAGLVDTLKGAGPFTEFAPTNEAIAALPAGVLDKLLKPENKGALTKILTYHVVSGKVPSTDVKDGAVKTLQGDTIKLTTADGVGVNDAKVIKADIMADNGVVHEINAVLLPPGFDPATLK
jgi:uncharacterized surface protein with fasciclin (FAS1) repeats